MDEAAAARVERLAQLDAEHAEQTEAAQEFMDSGFEAGREVEADAQQSPDERLAQLEAKLSQLRGLSSFLTSLPQQGSHAPPADATSVEPDEPDPRVLIAEWQTFDSQMSERLRDAFDRRREIDRSVEELESQLRYSDEATTSLQSEMMAMAEEVEGWASTAGEGGACDDEDQADALDAHEQRRHQPVATPIAEDVLGEIVMPYMDGAELSALACTCYALAARADEIFEQRVLRMLATDKFGAPVVGTASAPASVCAAFTSGAFPTARIGEDEAEEAEQAEIRVQLQRGWRRLFRVLHFAWMPPDGNTGYASTTTHVVASLVASAPELQGLLAAVLAAQVDAPTDVLEKMDAVEDFCAAQAAATRVGEQEVNTAAATAWLAVLLRHQTFRFRWLAATAGRGSTDTVAARLMRAVTTGRLAVHIRSAAEETALAPTSDCNVLTNGVLDVETAMVSELLARIAERELFQCLSLAWAVREDTTMGEQADLGGSSAVVAQAMVDVGLRELGSLYRNWSAWTSCIDDDAETDDEEAAVEQNLDSIDEQSEPEPEYTHHKARQRRVRVGPATECEAAVRSIASAIACQSAQLGNSEESGEQANALDGAAPSQSSTSVVELIAAEPALYSRWVRAEEGWSAPRVEALKQRGNAAFRQKDFETALQMYRDALELCDQTMVGGTMATGLSLLDELERDCLLNCAAASLQLEEAGSAAACCDAAIAIDSSHPKAFYRRAQAYTALRKRKRALADYEMAAMLAPKNAAINKAFKVAKQEALDREKARRKRFSNKAETASTGVV